MQHNYSYESALAASSRINWKVEDIIGGEKNWTLPSRSCRSRWHR
jgi:hypothetical protein